MLTWNCIGIHAFKLNSKTITHSCHFQQVVQVNYRCQMSGKRYLNTIKTTHKLENTDRYILTLSDISNSDPESESCIIRDTASSRVILAPILSNADLCFGLISLKLRKLWFFFIFSKFPGLFAVNRSSVEVISLVSGSYVAKCGKNQHRTDATLQVADRRQWHSALCRLTATLAAKELTHWATWAPFWPFKAAT